MFEEEPHRLSATSVARAGMPPSGALVLSRHSGHPLQPCRTKCAGGTPAVEYIEQTCRSAINRVPGGALPFRWTLNPYRGCAHACRYCYARRTHTYLDMDYADGFDRKIVVKVNLPQVLRRELSARAWRRELVAVGTATDPYQGAEVRYMLTRHALQAFCDFANPFSVTTKSPLVTRDLDLLRDAARGAGCTVYFSVGTLDEEVWRRVEPGAPHPRKRLEAMAKLVSAGVRAGVLMAPILPGLTDGDQEMEELVSAAAAHGAQFVSPIVLRLMEGARECYLPVVAERFPAAYERTLAMYPAVDAPRAYRRRVEQRVRELRQRHGLREQEDCAAPAPHRPGAATRPREGPPGSAPPRHPLRPPPRSGGACQTTLGL